MPDRIESTSDSFKSARDAGGPERESGATPRGSSGPSREVEIKLRSGDRLFPVQFRANLPLLQPCPESLLALSLLPAMRSGHDPDVTGPVSERLLSSLPTIVDIFCAWDEGLSRVAFPNLTPSADQRPPTGRAATFFSGGVDSFYTLLKRRDDITHVVFMRGFENEVQDNDVFERARAGVEAVAAQLGVELVQIETNVKPVLRECLDWFLSYGCFLAAVSHLIGHTFDRIYVPASFHYGNLIPCGSHPLLDPLWSTETLEIVHHGAGARRVDKVRFLSDFDAPLRHLRVCVKQPESGVNCGECEKCLRTMINLEVAGALGRCTTFTRTLDLAQLSFLRAKPSSRPFFAENIAALEKSGERPDLLLALRRCMEVPAWRDRLDRNLHRLLRRVGLSRGGSSRRTFT